MRKDMPTDPIEVLQVIKEFCGKMMEEGDVDVAYEAGAATVASYVFDLAKHALEKHQSSEVRLGGDA
jgi:hypothetical protein